VNHEFRNLDQFDPARIAKFIELIFGFLSIGCRDEGDIPARPSARLASGVLSRPYLVSPRFRFLTFLELSLCLHLVGQRETLRSARRFPPKRTLGSTM